MKQNKKKIYLYVKEYWVEIRYIFFFVTAHIACVLCMGRKIHYNDFCFNKVSTDICVPFATTFHTSHNEPRKRLFCIFWAIVRRVYVIQTWEMLFSIISIWIICTPFQYRFLLRIYPFRSPWSCCRILVFDCVLNMFISFQRTISKSYIYNFICIIINEFRAFLFEFVFFLSSIFLASDSMRFNIFSEIKQILNWSNKYLRPHNYCLSNIRYVHIIICGQNSSRANKKKKENEKEYWKKISMGKHKHINDKFDFLSFAVHKFNILHRKKSVNRYTKSYNVPCSPPKFAYASKKQKKKNE